MEEGDLFIHLAGAAGGGTGRGLSVNDGRRCPWWRRWYIAVGSHEADNVTLFHIFEVTFEFEILMLDLVWGEFLLIGRRVPMFLRS